VSQTQAPHHAFEAFVAAHGIATMAISKTANHSLPDDAVPLSQAARSIGGGIHTSTLHRWARKPLRRCPGMTLPIYPVGGRDFVSMRELREFLAAADPRQSAPERRSPTPLQLARRGDDRRRRADDVLNQEGI